VDASSRTGTRAQFAADIPVAESCSDEAALPIFATKLFAVAVVSDNLESALHGDSCGGNILCLDAVCSSRIRPMLVEAARSCCILQWTFPLAVVPCGAATELVLEPRPRVGSLENTEDYIMLPSREEFSFY
jgi:hypothetical protein